MMIAETGTAFTCVTKLQTVGAEIYGVPWSLDKIARLYCNQVLNEISIQQQTEVVARSGAWSYTPIIAMAVFFI